jgi:tetratricopeptide (TPR) repeat protein
MNKYDDFSININRDSQNKRRYTAAFILLVVFLVLVYSNSFDCSWHFDDYINIVGNSDIQITNLSWQNIQKGLYGVIGADRWQRPVSYFSFALNYYFNGLDVLGYHVFNLSIHCLTAFFLFLFVYHTLKLPIIRDRYEKSAYSIALLSALLWAINPVQVPAVTYIVQRMASMVALFYIMAMFFYLKGRTAEIAWKRIMFFVVSVFFGTLAVGTKENAAMLPVSIFLYDLLLIRGVTKESVKRSLPYGITAAIAVVVIGLLYIGDFSTINSDYQIRPFTMFERILTQPRVLVFYMSLLIYPLTSRMMLIHDIDVSRSLLEPWTTMPAIMTIILIIASALWIARKRPLIAYCIFFFFLNHLIEGSFIALELVYEHRNYLPSMLFFLPLAIMMIKGLQYFSRKKFIFLVLTVAMISVMIIQGVTVYIQNNIYKDDLSLWTDNMEKTPNLHHVRQNLATTHFVAGRFSEAFKEGTLALATYQAANPSRKSRTYGLLGEYYFINNDEGKALIHFEESLRLDPTFHTSYRRIAEIMIRKNRLQEAELWMRKGLSIKPGSHIYHAILARILLKKGDPDASIKEACISLTLNGNQSEPYAVMSDAFRVKKNDAIANHFRKVAKVMGAHDKDFHPVPIFMQALS